MKTRHMQCKISKYRHGDVRNTPFVACGNESYFESSVVISILQNHQKGVSLYSIHLR